MSEAKLYLLQVYGMSVTDTRASTPTVHLQRRLFFFFFFLFSTFFNVDPIAVTYNLNPSAEQHLPSMGEYRG